MSSKTSPRADAEAGSAAESAIRSPVGDAVIHKSGYLHTTGEATYIDDIPLPPGALHGALVTATDTNARILSVDVHQALACDGVVAFLDAKDVRGSNVVGLAGDEELFATQIVPYFGAVSIVVLAFVLFCLN